LYIESIHIAYQRSNNIIAKIGTTDRPEGFVPFHLTHLDPYPLPPTWYRLILACLAACVQCLLCSVGSVAFKLLQRSSLQGKLVWVVFANFFTLLSGN
jgi:hypothetical protein